MAGPTQQNGFEPSGFFAMRTPLLPFDELLKWAEGVESPAAVGDPDGLRKTIESDRARLRSRLHAAFAIPAVREALFVASPDLDESIETWMRDPASEHGRRIERALVRYFSRMAGRATPFGLFAGCSVGLIGNKTAMALAARDKYKRHTRLDMNYLGSLTDVMGAAPELKQTLVYRPNSSLYRAAGRIRYVESRFQNRVRTNHLVVVEETDYLDCALEHAVEGARPGDVAVAVAANDPDVTLAEAGEYVAELIDSQILVPDLQVKITGPESLDDLVEQFGRRPEMADVGERLEHVRGKLAAMDAEGLGAAPERYRALAAHLGSLPAEIELSKLFQVDMTKPTTEATLGPLPLKEIKRGVELLHRLSNRRQDGLSRFREAFATRYEDREVPLVEVMDEEIGIGYESSQASAAEAAPLLRELVFPLAESENSETFNRHHARLMRKLGEALTQGLYEMVLGPEDLKELGDENSLPLPDAFAATVALASSCEEAMARGDFRILLKGVWGPSGAVFLGRFCHADQTLREQVERHLRAEEALVPDAVFAEVVHMPGDERMGNVLSRPLLRRYEIPFLGESGATAAHQIPITDLWVSVSGGRVILRSKKLGCEVIPRLTSAHYYDHPRSLCIYRFLCALQRQSVSTWLAWEWGPLENVAFLPRVSTGRLVLSPARWNVSKAEVQAIHRLEDEARYLAVQEWRSQRKLPRFIGLLDTDNKLPIDLDNVLSIDTLIELVNKRDGAVLEEIYPPPDELYSHGPEGSYVHELIIPFVRVGNATRRRPPAEASIQQRSLRTFAPGSAWLYVKLYTGNTTADRLLRELISPVVAGAMRSGAADAWFFLRYSDPGWHLRLRLHGCPEKLFVQILPQLQTQVAALLSDGRLWRLQIDTYEREVERYGGMEGLLLAEKLFHIDSESVLDIIEKYQGDEGAEARWRFALRGIDMLLSDFGFNLETKRRIAGSGRETFLKEFRGNAGFKRQLGDNYRKKKKELETLVDPTYDGGSLLAEGFNALRVRSDRFAPVIDELKKYDRDRRLSRPLEELAASYIHMYVNRIQRSAQRAQELVLYDFLDRIYESRVMRAKNKVVILNPSPPNESALEAGSHG